MGNNCKTIVYLTTNTKNNKIYIGIHDTENPEKFDGYIGCGVNINYPRTISHPSTPFQYAVKKYGFACFIRATIKICETREEAIKIEKQLVDEDFILRNDTYNIELGGGDPPRNDIPVFQYSTTGEFIKEFSNRLLAEKEIGVTSGVSTAVKTKTLCGGYLWSNTKCKKLDISKYNIIIQKTPIYTYSSNGEYIKNFSSISDFCREYKVSLGPVQRAIATKTKIKGFYISKNFVEKFFIEKHKKSTSKIYQYTLSGDFVREWNSALEANRELGKKYSQISSYLRQGKPRCGDYQWSRVKVEKLNPIESPIRKRRVAQYDLNGNFIQEFDNVRACRKQFGNVSRVLSKKCKQCKGFTFKYVDN